MRTRRTSIGRLNSIPAATQPLSSRVGNSSGKGEGASSLVPSPHLTPEQGGRPTPLGDDHPLRRMPAYGHHHNHDTDID